MPDYAGASAQTPINVLYSLINYINNREHNRLQRGTASKPREAAAGLEAT